MTYVAIYGDVAAVPKLYNGILVLPFICHLEFFGKEIHFCLPFCLEICAMVVILSVSLLL